jgi:hypothetical protein
VRWLLSYVMAVLSAFVLAAIFSTQMVLSEVQAMGVPVAIGTRIAATSHDLVGLAPLYGSIMAIGFLIAMPAAAGILRFVPRLYFLGYTLAGAVAVLCILLSLKALLGITVLAGSRGVLGFALQLVAGAVGGYVFAAFFRRGRAGGSEAAPET